MERLVTFQDLEKYPHLVSQGVSLNQHFDFDALEAANETPPITEPTEEETHEPIKPKTKSNAIKPTQAKTHTKQKAKSK